MAEFTWKFVFLASLICLGGIARCKAADVIPSDQCGLVILGTLENGDDEAFRETAVREIAGGCNTLSVYLYSPGGSYSAAMKIADYVRALLGITEAPKRVERFSGPTPLAAKRICSRIPGDDKRRKEFSKNLDAEFQSAIRDKRLPGNVPGGFTFDPTTGEGDERCTCASACALVWLAGAERRGNVVIVHRPYFKREYYKSLGINDARDAYSKLQQDTRKFLTDLETPPSLMEKIFSTPSDKALYLTPSEIESLKIAPYYEELLTAFCGPEPGPEPTLPTDAADQKQYNGVFKYSSPADRRRMLKQLERDRCLMRPRMEMRKKVSAEFLKNYGY